MQKPYTILLAAASLDGRISLGPNRTMFDDLFDSRTTGGDTWREVEDAIYALHTPTADVLGSNSLVREGNALRDLPPVSDGTDPELLYENFLPDEVVYRSGHLGWMVIVDGRGRVRSGTRVLENRPGWHMLHWVSRATSPEYLHFLRQQPIPYIMAGEEHVDLTRALHVMATDCKVEKLITTAGGRLGGELVRRGLIDEVNIIVYPRIYGGLTTPSLFDSPNLGPDEAPIELKLATTQVYARGDLWLRYFVEHR